MNIDILKIDGSLIRNINKTQTTQKIVHSIQSLASSMNIKTVAEQVETKAEFEAIKAFNVDCIQGFNLGEPNATLVKMI